MVRINPGSFFPEHEFAQLDRNAVEQLVLGIDAASIAEQLSSAEDLDALALVPIAELIIKLLAENKDDEAGRITKLILRILIEGNSVFSSTIWQNILFTVIPSAVVLEKFDFLNSFIESEISDSIARSGLLAVAAQICLSKHHYQRAKTYLQKAKAAVAGEPLVSTFSIDELIDYTEAKLSGDAHRSLSELNCVHDHSSLSALGSDEEFDWDKAEGKPEIFEVQSQPTTDEVLEKWRVKLGGKEHDKHWSTKDDLEFFFQRFRPDGEGLEEFCADLHCQAITPRLLDIFRATSEGYKNGNLIDAYFIVRRPLPATDEELKSLAISYCDSLKLVASLVGDVEIKSYFESNPRVEIRRGETASLESSDIDIFVYQALHDYFSKFHISDEAALLTEALYTMANRYNLANYVLWPIAQSSSEKDSEDPYSKFFELWRRGVNPIFEDDKSCILYTVS